MRKFFKCLLVLTLDILVAPVLCGFVAIWLIGYFGIYLANRPKWREDVDDMLRFYGRLWNKQWDWIER